MTDQFPDDFNWGVATTAIQIEGGLDADGRGPSMWPDFARQPGKITHGDTPVGSAASYAHLDRDLDAVARLNLRSYNFSASWPRIQPDGSGRPNQQALDYYARLIDGLLERNVTPDLSLYDWDLPRRFVSAGKKGWDERDLADRFVDYADILLRHYGDRVTNWMTFNEVTTQATNGYLSGNHAPGYRDAQLAVRAYHHLMLAHGKAARRIREVVPQAEVSLVDNLLQYYPATITAADRDATDRSWTINAWYLLHALFKGEYYEPFLTYFRDHHDCNFDHLRPGDLDVIGTPLDKFGVNYFTSFVVSDAPDAPGADQKISAAPGPRSDYGWTIDPRGMTEALRKLKRDFTGDLPLFIGECGIGNYDYPDPTGRVNDRARIDYLHQHLEQVLVARGEGIPVKGFYVWSLMDNYEWDNGYKKRMGLFYTQYHQPAKYLIKDSGKWYAELCKTGRLREEL